MFQVASITKSFKEKAVLKGVSFSIEEGDKIALLGNNGAGKSTLFNIIAGQLQADSGTIKTSLDFQREIGMMPQGDLLIEDLTVAEFVELKSRMNQLKQADINGLLEMVELRESREQMVGSLSGGQKRRLSLLLTILNHPRLIFLDEPTTGLHIEDVKRLLKVLNRMVEEGATIIIIEHNLDVIKMADYIIDLGPEGGTRGGTIVAKGTPEEVANVEGSYTGKYLNKILTRDRKRQMN